METYKKKQLNAAKRAAAKVRKVEREKNQKTLVLQKKKRVYKKLKRSNKKTKRKSNKKQKLS